MRNNDIIKKDNTIYRIIDLTDTKAFVIDCSKKTMPKWVDKSSLSSYSLCSEELEMLPDINDMDMLSRKVAYERFTVISNIIPFVTDKNKRSAIISQTAIEKGISRQTVCTYLWLYLVYQNISALAPKPKENEKELSETEKNINYALNKYFYNQDKNALSTAYTLMLKEKYCDSEGHLLPQYPSFYQFRYFYRKHRKLQNYYISRNGIKNYQRNERPLLGNGIQDFAHSIGFGMLDSTICDIYLINTSGEIIGRPILTACVDSYSGLCCGYSLSWEGGVYSLRSLMLNVISDKKKWCRKFGIKIDKADWNCDKLPTTLITDMGKEYASANFEQISDLGVTVINLPPYRPELKGMVEKFFDIIQNLYKPYLKGKGIIEPDFQERGGYDYRKDSCLTMNDFEKIIIRCIIHYNTKIVKENFPYTEKMLSENIKPFSNCIWNYSMKQMGVNLIDTDSNTLILTLLPRTLGKFSRKGLVVNKLHYKNENYTEQYLSGGTVTVAYNPENVGEVWLVEDGTYTPFELIETRFTSKSISEVKELQNKQQTIINENKPVTLQAKIDLATHIETISSHSQKGNADIKGIRSNRKKERQKTHIDYVKDGAVNE